MSEKAPEYFTPEEVDQLVAVAGQRRENRLVATRDRALIRLLYVTGLRLHELTQLNVCDLNPDTKQLHVVRGKGGKARWTNFNVEAWRAVEAYLDLREDVPVGPAERRHCTAPLFLSRLRRRLSDRMVEHLISTTAAKAGLEGHTHKLRHSCGTELYRQTRDLRKVQKHLGHRRSSTTEIYTHVDLEEAVEGL